MSTDTKPVVEALTTGELTADRKRVRVFISSPSDVRPERLVAQRLVERLAREFSAHFRVEPVLWEREPLVATEHFQASITPPHDTDIVVVILWSRLGVLMPVEQFPGAFTGRQVTGTEWEFEDAFAAYQQHGRPDLLVYRKTAAVLASLEDDAALEQQRHQKRLVQDFMQRWFIDLNAKTFTLASRDFTTTTEFEELLEVHLRALLIKQLSLVEGETLQSGIHWHQGNPFRGLESFELEHAPVFFGRTRARNELRELLARQVASGCAFVLVLGASGSGKSSLVKAGLLPDLQLRGMIGRVALSRHAVLRPADGPGDMLDGLAGALLSPTALPELAELQYDRLGLSGLLREAPSQVALPLRQGLARAAAAEKLTEHAEARLVLVIDQLEELFTHEGLTLADRAAFVTALQGLARSGLVWVVATMRSDFFDRLEGLPTLAQLSAGEARYLLTPPDAAELGQIVRQPARETGLRFAVDRERGCGLDDVLVQAAAQAPAALPLLEFTLDQLWQRRTDRGELTFTAYEELGGLEGALGQRAEEAYSGLPAEVQAALPQVLRALATVGQGVRGAVTARAVPLAAFLAGSPQRQLVEALLAPQARLLVADGDTAGAVVRVAHEALLTHWARAHDQLLHDRADLQTRGRLEQAVALWQAATGADRDSRLLPTGLPLAEAEDLLKRRRDELDSPVIAYIEASTAAAQAQARRARRRWRAAAAVFAVLALLAVLAAAVAYNQKYIAERQSQIALAQQLAAQANRFADLGSDEAVVERAGAFAVESWKRLHNLEASDAASKLLRMLPSARIEHGDEVWSVAFSPDGRLLATGSKDNTARLIATATGMEVARIAHDGWVDNVTFSPDGRFLATGSKDNMVRLITTATDMQAATRIIEHGGEVYRVAFSPDGRLLATGSADNMARLFATATGTEVARFPHGGEVWRVDFSPDGRFLATGSKDNMARLFEIPSGHEVARLPHDGTVRSIAFSRDGQLLATGSEDNTARLFEIPSGHEVARLPHDGMVYKVAFSSDGRFLATGSKDNMARLFEIPSGREVARLPHGGPVWSVAFSLNGQFLATGSEDKTARLFEIPSGQEVARIPHGNPVRMVSFSPNSQLLATGSADNMARLIATAPGTEVVRVQHGGAVRSIAVSPDGRFLATGSEDNTARLIATATGTEVTRIQHNGAVRSINVSPDGRLLATGSTDNTARLIATATGTEVARIQHNGVVGSVAISPDGRWLATGSEDKTARLFEIPSGREVAQIQHDEAVYGVAISPDGRWLATESEDKTARLIEIPSGREVARFEHGKAVLSISFSPDGRWLATGSADNLARLIGLPSGQEVARFEHGGTVSSVFFSSDSKFLATGSVDNTARLVWADPQHLFDLLCTKAGRNLNQAEWGHFLGAGGPWRPTCTSWR
jgi:uncharacterized delta-60 repeat protein